MERDPLTPRGWGWGWGWGTGKQLNYGGLAQVVLVV